MDRPQGDAAAIVAANLVQAEMVMRAATLGPSKADQIAMRYSSVRSNVFAAYEHYLALVTTGKPPESPAE